MTMSNRADAPTAFFARSPFGSLAFLASVVLLAGGVSLGLFVMVRYWERTNAALIAVLIGPVTLWFQALQQHGRIRELYQAQVISDVPPTSPLGVTMSAAEDLFNLLLLCVSSMSCGLWIGILYPADAALLAPCPGVSGRKR